MGDRRRDAVLRASEVGQYTFCAHAWWLGNVEGHPSSNRHALADGQTAHRRHGRGVHASATLSRLAYVLLLLAVLIGVFLLVQAF